MYITSFNVKINVIEHYFNIEGCNIPSMLQIMSDYIMLQSLNELRFLIKILLFQIICECNFLPYTHARTHARTYTHANTET